MSEFTKSNESKKAELVNKLLQLSELKKSRIQSLKYSEKFIVNATILAGQNWVDKFNNNAPDVASALGHFNDLLNAANRIDAQFWNLDSDNEELQSLEKVSCGYISYIRSQLFIALVAEIEDFINQMLMLVLLAYPEKIGINTKIELGKVLEILDLDKIIESMAFNKITTVFYGNVETQKKNILKVLSMNDELLNPVWKEFIEIKTRRDSGLHNNWKVNSLYKEKVTGVGGLVSENNFLGVDKAYFEISLEVVENFITICQTHSSEKFKYNAD